MRRLMKLLNSRWITFSSDVTKLNERDAWELLDAEQGGKRRRLFLKRLYAHANKLRVLRQRAGLKQTGALPGDRP